MGRYTGALEHCCFFELPKILRKGDCLVLNDSRVMPARLLGVRDTGGSVEVLLLHEVDNNSGEYRATVGAYRDEGIVSAGGAAKKTWECLVKPGRKVKPDTRLVFGDGELTATVKSETADGNRLIEFNCDREFREVLEKLGTMPLPPYIHEELKDAERYQTVYSREVGSAAAPTAGLHFTQQILDKLSLEGIDICFMTLHVGLGTFRPVKTEKIEDHLMHSEYFTIPEETANKVNHAKENGSRIIAIGTTSCRALESVADEAGRISVYSGQTDIFIYPGYKFKCIDGLLTNFHLPESTLIMLVSAFAGKDNTMRAYEEAVRMEYRFFSFGDAMLIS